MIGPAVAALLISDSGYLAVNLMAGFCILGSLFLFLLAARFAESYNK